MSNVRLYAIDGGLALESPFNADVVAGIKNLPYSDRKWDKANRRWIVAAQHGPTVAQLVMDTLGIALDVPSSTPAAAAAPSMRIVRLEYLGRCKQRGDETMASGFADGDWSLLFPEPILRSWFMDEARNPEEPRQPAKPQTLYQVLALKQDATPEDVKRMYRQFARQWHPDVCKEPDASERFQRIQRAYEVLRDDKLRRRYDAGLKLEASQQDERDPLAFVRPFGQPKNMMVNRHDDDVYGYRAPLRCGQLMVEGVTSVGQFVVQKIHMWSDIVDNGGKTMVASWPAGAKTFTIAWV